MNFNAPWQAQAFALVALLKERGLISSSEWASALGREIARARDRGDRDSVDEYYRCWLTALEEIVSEKDIAGADVLERHRLAWDQAARRTPHGSPIELTPDDFL